LTVPELLVPGQVYRFDIDLWASSNVFFPGHRPRVSVTSSNFPRFDRNLNTGGPSTARRWGRWRSIPYCMTSCERRISCYP
ncbi:MAG TPA: hypothetical protein DIC52_18870, partial [Candidatus Latescibacteria bacterium]|nr:hypothetical protein [Candidatus Latescibacterota bacterium]